MEGIRRTRPARLAAERIAIIKGGGDSLRLDGRGACGSYFDEPILLRLFILSLLVVTVPTGWFNFYPCSKRL